jgi:hypothetical protein
VSDSLSKKHESTKTTGRFATPEEAALAKNANLINHIKNLGLKVEKLMSSPE